MKTTMRVSRDLILNDDDDVSHAHVVHEDDHAYHMNLSCVMLPYTMMTMCHDRVLHEDNHVSQGLYLHEDNVVCVP